MFQEKWLRKLLASISQVENCIEIIKSILIITLLLELAMFVSTSRKLSLSHSGSIIVPCKILFVACVEVSVHLLFKNQSLSFRNISFAHSGTSNPNMT
jgi:hypothetical protein